MPSSANPFRLDGKLALVTGAGRGIGRAIALALAAAGAELCSTAAPGPNSRRSQPRSSRSAAGARPLPFDVTDSAAARRRSPASPRLDVLVNNAGMNRPQPFLEVDEATLDRMIALNIKAAFVVAQAAARHMAGAGAGVIINMSSQMGHVGSERHRTVYVMTKHAVEGLTKAMAVELAPRGVRVVSIAPTFIETPLTQPFFDDPIRENGSSTASRSAAPAPSRRWRTRSSFSRRPPPASSPVPRCSPMAAGPHGDPMRRRELILGVAGAAVAWPPAARAQQKAMPVIGLLGSSAADPKLLEQLPPGSRRGRVRRGAERGDRIALARGPLRPLAGMAADLVARRVAVITALAVPAAEAAKAATATIPIVFYSGTDPVEYGLVTSLAHPGGNLTGVADVHRQVGPEAGQLLHDLLPAATVFGLIVNPRAGATAKQVSEVARQIKTTEDAVRAPGMQMVVANAGSEAELGAGLCLAAGKVGGVILGADPSLAARTLGSRRWRRNTGCR